MHNKLLKTNRFFILKKIGSDFKIKMCWNSRASSLAVTTKQQNELESSNKVYNYKTVG